jgi:Zn-dependent peptidase ImmA (M78 family)
VLPTLTRASNPATCNKPDLCHYTGTWLKKSIEKEDLKPMDNGKVFEELIKICRAKNILVLFAPFKGKYGMVRKERIGIANDMNLENINKTLAHEIAHTYLHYDKGNIVENKNSNYEEQADRAAFMLLDTIQIIES